MGTEFNECFAELEETDESTILRVREPVERGERHEQRMFRRVEHQISLLTAVLSNQGRFVVRTVEHVDIVERTAN